MRRALSSLATEQSYAREELQTDPSLTRLIEYDSIQTWPLSTPLLESECPVSPLTSYPSSPFSDTMRKSPRMAAYESKMPRLYMVVHTIHRSSDRLSQTTKILTWLDSQRTGLHMCELQVLLFLISITKLRRENLLPSWQAKKDSAGMNHKQEKRRVGLESSNFHS